MERLTFPLKLAHKREMASLILAFLFSISAHAEPTIAILGDSLTEGYGLAKDSAFPSLLEKKLKTDSPNAKVINAGVSGSTSAGGVSRLDWVLKSKPDILIVALGSNDGLRGLSTKELQNNLLKIVKAAKERKVKVLLLGMKVPPNYGKNYDKEFEGVFERVAKLEKIPFLPFLLEDVAGRSNLNLPDGIHPNEKGHAILADRLYPFVKKNLQ
jgi:acyl-CoA thioesterase I